MDNPKHKYTLLLRNNSSTDQMSNGYKRSNNANSSTIRYNERAPVLAQQRFNMLPESVATYTNGATASHYTEVLVDDATVEIDEHGMIKGRVNVSMNGNSVTITRSRTPPQRQMFITLPIRTLVLQKWSTVRIAGSRFADITTISASCDEEKNRSLIQFTQPKEFRMLHLIVNGAVDCMLNGSRVMRQCFVHFNGMRTALLTGLEACKNTDNIVIGNANVQLKEIDIPDESSTCSGSIVHSGPPSPASPASPMPQETARAEEPKEAVVVVKSNQVIVPQTTAEFDYGDSDDELAKDRSTRVEQGQIVIQAATQDHSRTVLNTLKPGADETTQFGPQQRSYPRGRGLAGPTRRFQQQQRAVVEAPSRGQFRAEPYAQSAQRRDRQRLGPVPKISGFE
jgi:hypothetical protein